MLASDLPVWFVRLFAFAFGAIWGSFGNVVIYRWPRELSVVSPPSHCFHCGKPIAAYDNVPIFAYLWLRGRCRHCGTKFSPRYAIVELIFAVISTAIAERVFFHTSLSAPIALATYAVRFTVAFFLLVTSFIDLDEMLVPNFVKWSAVVPVIGAAALPTTAPTVDLVHALAGAAVGYLGLRLTFIDGYRLLTGRPGMGLGDAEVLAVVGALLGPSGVFFALGAGALQGVLAAGIAALFGARVGPEFADEVEDDATGDTDHHDGDGDDNDHDNGGKATDAPTEPSNALRPKMKIPFVPFLALAALEYLLGADALVDRYLQFIRGDL